jgi:hypothetical protein
MYYSSIGVQGSGFTNQLFSLITSILIAYYNKNKVVVIDYFSNDFSKNSYSCISQILDLKKINFFLKEKYDLIIVDKYDVNFELNQIFYGTLDNNIEITDIIKKMFFKNGNLIIPKSTDFNLICGDPCVGVKKHIFLKYIINGFLIEELHEENLLNDVIIDFFNTNYQHSFAWINSINKIIFEDILLHLKYNNDYINLSKNILEKININKNINLLHLRLEEDAIKHWSKQNNMSEEYFKNYLEIKYISLIKNHIDPKDQTIILSGSLTNGVIDFLIQNNYNYILNDKYFDEREKNAIIDFLISNNCNNVFIGNFNFENLNGSTFSYYIQKLLNTNVKKINIDLDKIYDNEKIY